MKELLALFCAMLVLPMFCHAGQEEVTRFSRVDGAIATLQLYVTDDKGTPVEGATVWVNFWKPGSVGGNQAFGETDANGNVTLSERCYSDGWYGIEKDGYYKTRKRIVTPPYDSEHMEEGFIRLHWKKPFVSTEVLRPIKNPSPMIARGRNRFKVPKLNTPIGFDLKEMDWTSPYGQGTVEDLRISVMKSETQPTSVIFDFVRPGDGVQICDQTDGSELRSDYHVDTTKPFLQTIELKYINASTSYLLRSDKYLVFRVRSLSAPDGQILKAHYGKIYPFISLEVDRLKIMRIYFNPVPNDTNLEFDPERNLAPSETREQRQRRRVYLP